MKATYLGLELDSPVVVSSSPYTATLANIEQCAAAGAGAVVLKSIFEEQILHHAASLEQYSDSPYGDASDYLQRYLGEDYKAGFLRLVSEARRAGVVTALDPKPESIAPVKGISVMKPNRSEAFALAGMHDSSEWVHPFEDRALAEVARRLLDAWEPEQLLISLAAQGMALFGRDGTVEVIPTRAREVFDVSGAGDTVTATFTLALVSGATPVQAAELANRAAGVVVAKVGTVPVHFAELEEALKEA